MAKELHEVTFRQPPPGSFFVRKMVSDSQTVVARRRIRSIQERRYYIPKRNERLRVLLPRNPSHTAHLDNIANNHKGHDYGTKLQLAVLFDTLAQTLHDFGVSISLTIILESKDMSQEPGNFSSSQKQSHNSDWGREGDIITQKGCLHIARPTHEIANLTH